jgi:hypothetical protein
MICIPELNAQIVVFAIVKLVNVNVSLVTMVSRVKDQCALMSAMAVEHATHCDSSQN